MSDRLKEQFDAQDAAKFHTTAAKDPGGFMSIDDRASGGKLTEMDTFTCVHCNSIVVMHPMRIRPRNVCLKCDGTTCDQEACVVECDHWEKKWEAGRPWLQPHQYTDALTDEIFTPEVKAKTPDLWVPRKAGGTG